MTGGEGESAPSMTESVLAAFEGVYVALGSHGWSPDEVDRWDVPTVSRFLGDKRFDPVIRGQRGPLLLERDKRDRPAGRAKGGQQHGSMDPSKLTPRTRDPGIVLTGDAAR